MSLREGCNEVLKADCVDLAERLYRGQRRGLKVREGVHCAICAANIVTVKPTSGIVVFFCHHVYHQKCLRSGNAKDIDQLPAESPMKLADDEKLWCTLCQSLKQTKRSRARTVGRKLGIGQVKG